MQNPMFEEGGWCDRWSPTFLSILRIMTALLFLSHGTSKILGVPLSTASFPPPWTQFWVAGMLELIGLLGAAVFLRVLGGVTGDTFGAVNKLTEVTTYAALAAAW